MGKHEEKRTTVMSNFDQSLKARTDPFRAHRGEFKI